LAFLLQLVTVHGFSGNWYCALGTERLFMVHGTDIYRT